MYVYKKCLTTSAIYEYFIQKSKHPLNYNLIEIFFLPWTEQYDPVNSKAVSKKGCCNDLNVKIQNARLCYQGNFFKIFKMV